MRYDYDLLVIGGGAAGLVAATGSAALGAKTALVEKAKLGGDCTWHGCIPSKTLLKSAQVFSLFARAKEFGISVDSGAKFSADLVMAHVRQVAKKIAANHPAELFEKRGVKVFFGSPHFIDANTIELSVEGGSVSGGNGRRISAKRFIIACGSHPLIPTIDGLNTIDYLTNENIFDLEVLPKSLVVLGAGPIGVELAQGFSRLGVDVSLVEMLARPLMREDKEITEVLASRLKEDGVKIFTGKKAVLFSRDEESVIVTLEDKEKKLSLVKTDKVLVAIGRAANVEGLGLEKAGVKYSSKGIDVDAVLKTSARNIYACGDIVGPYQFSHMAEYQAIIALGNALLPFKRRVDYSSVPWCTFSEPELARVGLTEEEARARYKRIKIYRSVYGANDRAVTDLEETGLVKVITDKRGYILGAHIVGAHAGELIHEYVVAKSAGLRINKLSSAIHVYPTLSQVIKRSADQYYLNLMNKPLVKMFFRLILKFL